MPAIVFLLSILSLNLEGHEIRPGYLEIKSNENHYNITWKTPMKGDGVLPIKPVFPEGCKDLIPIKWQRVPGALIEKRKIDCGANGLTGERIHIKNLTSTLTDVLVRVENAKGVQNLILKPQRPYFIYKGKRHWTLDALDFVRIGMEHILIGIDHLLFVLGLLLIVSGKTALFKTITSFTIAHSLTLALSVYKVVEIPIGPIEAAIALSIFFLGPEIVRTWKGESSLMIRYPWVISFIFGLLHGFGFATGLSLTGMPQGEIPFTLLWFNIGVELGQLLFVFLTLILARGLQKLTMPIWIKKIPGYVIGSAGAFWFIQRTYMLF